MTKELPSNAMLVVIRGPKNKGDIYKLGARNLTGGRDAGNLIQILDNEVSRRHFLIRTTPQGYMISDLRSANGTLVNGEKVQASYLNIGDVVRAGNTHLLMSENIEEVPDAVLGERVTDRGLSAVPTQFAGGLLQVDEPEAMAPEPMEPDELEPAPEPSLQPARSEPPPAAVEQGLPRLASPRRIRGGVPGLVNPATPPQQAAPPDDAGVEPELLDAADTSTFDPGAPTPAPVEDSRPRVVDTMALSRQRTSEMDMALRDMAEIPQYLDLATHIIRKAIRPDRAVVLQLSAERKLHSRSVYLRSEIEQQARQVPPALHLVSQALRQRQPVLDNRLQAPAGETFPATALVVPVLAPGGSALGVLYVDSFAGTHKLFVELDTSVMQKVAAVLARRWQG